MPANKTRTTSNIPTIRYPRQIKTFVQRQGRLTKGQARAIELLWPRFGLELDAGPLTFDALFDDDRPVTLEIGFGNGRSLAAMALADPERGFIGIEVHRPGVGQLLQRIEENEIQNIRIFSADALDVLEQKIPAASLDRIQLFFPDPWPKKKHHKRRILNKDFAALAASRLRHGGIFHMATDWEDYAHVALELLQNHPAFDNLCPDGFSARPQWRPLTKFEQRGQRLGHGVWDLLFERNRNPIRSYRSPESVAT